MDEEIEQRIPLPRKEENEMFAIVEQHMGGGRLKIICEDRKSRMARIPGKIKRKRWIKTGDFLIIRTWDFQDEKADVVYRYTSTQVLNLDKKNLIPETLKGFL